MPTAEELRAQLKVVELEEKLAAAKDTEEGASEVLKAKVRDARREYRAKRDGLVITKNEKGRTVAVEAEGEGK